MFRDRQNIKETMFFAKLEFVSRYNKSVFFLMLPKFIIENCRWQNIYILFLYFGSINFSPIKFGKKRLFLEEKKHTPLP